MFAIIAAILFGLALLLQLVKESMGELITPTTLTTAGLLCVALHMAGAATAFRGYRRRR